MFDEAAETQSAAYREQYLIWKQFERAAIRELQREALQRAQAKHRAAVEEDK